ncbi:MAG: class I SAM-dependent methyltransferase [Actinomycetaceae bacterium]|nr:class I SAM-dependent methyltransferase [Actinomycetaceae bacterium]
MAANHTQAWAYVEDAFVEDDVTVMARHEASDFGISCLSAATCAFIRMFAGVAQVKTAVEVGTGTGVSGLSLLANPGLSLTSIDVESEAQHSAREYFAAAGVRSGRARLIHGRSADLLPRLAAKSYDLVLLDGDPLETPGDAQEALRLLSPGGILIVARALAAGRVADPARREEDVVAMRNLGRELLASPELETSLLPVGDGLILATVR